MDASTQRGLLSRWLLDHLVAVFLLLLLTPLGACGNQKVEEQQRSLTGRAPSLELVSGFARPIEGAARLLEDTGGSLYGLSRAGGAQDHGALWKRLPDGSLVTLHHFSGDDGSWPIGRLADGAGGTLYGATRAGGANGLGTLFQYTAGGLLTLHHFSAVDGNAPSAPTVGSDSALYGTTEDGGPGGFGTLFKWDVSSGLTVLHAFDRTTGGYPYAGVIQGSDGALYGTTDLNGGNTGGTLFKWQAGQGLATLHSFGGSEGASPSQGGLVEAGDGALYGTTTRGGSTGFGTLFKWQAGTGVTTLHAFDYYGEGGYPLGSVVAGSDGGLYGTTSAGAAGKRGGVFRWSPSGGMVSLRSFLDDSSGYPTDGASPQWGVQEGADGALYGTTEAGGAGHGVLFRLTTDGATFSVLHRFGESNVVAPGGRIALAPDGSLYGTSREGGAHGQGTVYRVSAGAPAVLHSFDFDDGAAPESGLLLGSDGAFYGTTGQGAAGCGTLFKWSESDGLSTLHIFSRPTTGCYPYGGVIQSSDGFYYGTTSYGGANEAGTLFRWDGSFAKLHDFDPATDGGSPSYHGLVLGADGAMYGTTSSGGPDGAGTIFRWDGSLTVLHPFTGTGGQGSSPMAGVIQASDLALYGTTSYGGSFDLGTLWRWSSAGGLVTLHSFGGTDGQYPYLPLVQRPDGMIYGLADTVVPASGSGVLFQWDPMANQFDEALTIAPSTGAYPSAWLVNGPGGEAYGTTWEGGPEGGGTLFRLAFTPIDPCATNNGGCDPNATCANQSGTPVCTCNPGYSGDGLACVDINECLTGNGGCDPNATCTNTIGSRTCACNPGYQGDGLLCTDTNECLTSNGGCDPNATCTNTIGSRTCACNAGYIGDGLVCVPVALVAILVTPASPSIAKGRTLQFVATGTYNDGSTQILTTQVSWSSSSTSVAIVSNGSGSQGRATGTGVGTATITATLGGVSGSTTLSVTPAVLVAIGLSPSNPAIAKGTDVQFIATGTYSDSTVANLTTQVSWSSSATSVATISNAAGSQGRATGVAVGATTIMAVLGGVLSSTGLTVNAAILESLDVEPLDPSVAKGNTLQFQAIGTYTDDTTQDLTESASWSSSAGTVAAVANTPGDKGLATALSVGVATITATFGGFSDYADLTVTPATLVSIVVAPPAPSIAKGTNIQFVATGSYSDGSTADLTSQVLWSSSAEPVATVSNVAGSWGLAFAVAAGTSAITATFGTVSGGTVLTVSAAELVSIAVTPANPSIPRNIKVQFTALATYTDGSTQNITGSAAWTSSNTAVATIGSGLATVVAAGTTTISAISGGISGSTILTGTNATLSSISVTPKGPTIIQVGETLQMTATGTFSDGSKLDLTTQVTWKSSRKRTASVSSTGLVTGIRVRNTNVTIRAKKSGKTGTATVRVQ